jgi:hypothetical protein
MNRTRWLATAAAGVVLAVGGGVALAAGGSSDPNSDFLGDVAQRLGVSQDDLERAIEDATIARIDEAVDKGDISKEDAEALKKRIRSGDSPAILPSLRGKGLGVGPLGLGGPKPRLVVPGGKRFGPHELPILPGILPGADLMDTAADYLGVDEAEVRRALGRGTSLAELAKSKGKSVDGLKDALRGAIRDDADKAVDDGDLTRKQADDLVERLGKLIDELVDTGLEGGFGFRFKGGDGHRDFELHLRVGPNEARP